MSHKYFTINERNKLEVLLKENYKITSELKNLIESKLCERWSLEQIIGRDKYLGKTPEDKKQEELFKEMEEYQSKFNK